MLHQAIAAEVNGEGNLHRQEFRQLRCQKRLPTFNYISEAIDRKPRIFLEEAGAMAPTYAELVELLVDGARFGDAEDVELALQHNVDVNAQDDMGRTGE
jgi:hypothetical protein